MILVLNYAIWKVRSTYEAHLIHFLSVAELFKAFISIYVNRRVFLLLLLNAFHNEDWIKGVQTHKYICFISESFSIVINEGAFCMKKHSASDTVVFNQKEDASVWQVGILPWEYPDMVSDFEKWASFLAFRNDATILGGKTSWACTEMHSFCYTKNQMSIWCSFTASRITCLVRTRWNDTFTSLRGVFSKHLWISHGFPCKAKSVNISEISNFSLNIRKTRTKKHTDI